MVYNSPKWPHCKHTFSKFIWVSIFPDPPKGLSPSAVTLVLFNLFLNWSIVFSLFKWSIPALLYRHFTCKLCVFFSELWIYLHLYIVKEGFSFLLMNTFHSPLIGEGRRRFAISFRFVFISIQICLFQRMAGLLIFAFPRSPNMMGEGRSP